MQIIIHPLQAAHGGALGLLAAGSTQDVPEALAIDLVGSGQARWVTPPSSRVGVLDIPAAPLSSLASRDGLDDALDSLQWADQFGVDESPALPVEPVTASATGIAIAGACAIASIYCVTVGTGTLTVHDDYSASDATKLRFSRADSAMAAAGVYPMVSDAAGTAMLFDTGAFVTVPSGGIYVLDVVRPGSAIRGVRGSGLLCMPRRVAASGLAVEGICNVASIKVIAPGSSGNLAVYDDRVATNANRLRYPVTAFGSLTADQIITFGRNPRRFGNINITVPTGGIVLVNTLVR
jgi:hypothetical protein